MDIEKLFYYFVNRAREVSECVTRVRLISWLLMGALCNSRGGQHPLQQPVPQDATCHITDHIQVSLTYVGLQNPVSSVAIGN